MNHAQAYKDRQYLWKKYGPANDMTGNYQDSDDLEKLLKTPNATTATECLTDQILYWFEEGPDLDLGTPEIREWRTDPEVRRIADRHGATGEFLDLSDTWRA